MEYYLSLLTFTFVAGITPGPNNLMLVVSGLNHGVQKSLPHYFGICFGFPLMVAVIGFGLGTLFLKLPSLYLSIKVLGISYLLFLAWKIANAGNMQAKKTLREPLTFLQAATFQWINPKAWTIGVSAIAAFTVQSDISQSVATIVLAYLIMAFICQGIWLKLGEFLQKILSKDSRIQLFNIGMAVLLMLSVIPMILSEIN